MRGKNKRTKTPINTSFSGIFWTIKNPFGKGRFRHFSEAAGIEPTSADRLTTVLKTAGPPGPIYFRVYYTIASGNSQMLILLFLAQIYCPISIIIKG